MRTPSPRGLISIFFMFKILIFLLFLEKNRLKSSSKKGWHTEPRSVKTDGRTKPWLDLPKSPFLSLFRRFLPAVAGKCWKPSPEPSPTLIPAFFLSRRNPRFLPFEPCIYPSEFPFYFSFSRSVSSSNANPRHRDLHTGDTAAHGAFCRIRRAHGLPRKKSPQTADTGGRRRSMQQCKDIRKPQS